MKMKPGDLMVVILYETTTQQYYFPGMVNLVKESVECCLEGQSLKRKTDGSETIVRIVRMSLNIEMLVTEIGSRHIYYARSMIRLTICFTVRNS